MEFKLTKKRQAILDVLQANHRTMTAAQVHTALPDIDLATIYRNLELFTKSKIIKQFHLTSGEAEYEYQSTPHHHAVCDDCDKVIHFTTTDDKIKSLLGLDNFEVNDIEMTVKGRCQDHFST